MIKDDDSLRKTLCGIIAACVFVLGSVSSSCANSDNGFCQNWNQKLTENGVQI